MPALDIPTLLAVFIASNVLVGLLMLLAFQHRLTPALRTWMASLFLQAIGWSMLAKCSMDYNIYGYVVISFSYCLMLHALLMYFGVRCRYGWAYWPFAFPLVLLMFLPDELWLRHLFAHLISAFQVSLVGGTFFVRSGGSTILRRLIGSCGLIGAALLLLRAVQLYHVQETTCVADITDPNQSFMFLIFVIIRLAFMFGFLLLIESKQLEAITRLATLDPLTETYNRRSFHELAEAELQRARRKESPISLLAIDLDHFKLINDKFGHKAGDIMLRHVRDVVKNCLRSHDIFARHGGEEFMVLAPDTGPEGAARLAERLRLAIEASEADNGLKITASFGICSWGLVTDDHSLDQLVTCADDALYEAKAAGRNCVRGG